MLDITVIILTFNEELHIRRCIESVKSFAKQIVVVDSESTDQTVALAKSIGAEVYVNKWPGNQAAQFNWALDNVKINSEWILRLDADEYPTPELVAEIEGKLPVMPGNVNGVTLPLKNVWMGKALSHGGSSIRILRLFRTGFGRYENRMMDEQLQITSGDIIGFDNPFVDDNLNDLNWWTTKHLNYAVREAAELLDLEYDLSEDVSKRSAESLCDEAKLRRNRKLKYSKQPLFWRSFAYFIYRYFFKGGFREGKEGFLRHFLQGWWYRTFVDAKILEVKKACGDDRAKIKNYLKEKYNVKF